MPDRSYKVVDNGVAIVPPLFLALNIQSLRIGAQYKCIEIVRMLTAVCGTRGAWFIMDQTNIFLTRKGLKGVAGAPPNVCAVNNIQL